MAQLSRVAWNLASIAAFAALIVASMAWYNRQPTLLDPSTSAVYRLAGGAWQRLPEFPGTGEALHVSPDGAALAMGFDHGKGELFARLSVCISPRLSRPARQEWLAESAMPIRDEFLGVRSAMSEEREVGENISLAGERCSPGQAEACPYQSGRHVLPWHEQPPLADC